MSSRFYPSLGQVIWGGEVTPEWIPLADEQAWQRSMTALHYLWQESGQPGVLLSGPVLWVPPTGSPQDTEDRWLFTDDWSPSVLFQPQQIVVPILPRDPLRQERFLILITPLFAAVLVGGVHPEHQRPGLSLSFEPEVLHRAWYGLQLRLHQGRPDCLPRWEQLSSRFPWRDPHPRLLARFSTLVLLAAHDPLPPPPPPPRQLPAATPTEPGIPDIPKSLTTGSVVPERDPEEAPMLSEAELLRALAHEIRTPLTSILTLVKLLLRRADVAPEVRTYLEKIQRECYEQIDRFNLIFQAVDLDTHRVMQLQSIPLRDLLIQHGRDWQALVQRRGSTLELDIPDYLPDVVSDPPTLMRILQGVIERIARSSIPGSRMVAQWVTAGEQVKMQLQVIPPHLPEGLDLTPAQPLGHLLIYQPTTGAISLSLPVTQALFRSLGGYLTVKHSPASGETVTIYLPCVGYGPR